MKNDHNLGVNLPLSDTPEYPTALLISPLLLVKSTSSVGQILSPGWILFLLVRPAILRHRDYHIFWLTWFMSGCCFFWFSVVCCFCCCFFAMVKSCWLDTAMAIYHKPWWLQSSARDWQSWDRSSTRSVSCRLQGDCRANARWYLGCQTKFGLFNGLVSRENLLVFKPHINNGKIMENLYGFRLRFSLKPIHWIILPGLLVILITHAYSNKWMWNQIGARLAPGRKFRRFKTTIKQL